MKRYNIFGPPGCMEAEESNSGEWVRWEDVKHLVNSSEKKSNWMYGEDYDSDVDIDPEWDDVKHIDEETE